jgi:hypothetical protein
LISVRECQEVVVVFLDVKISSHWTGDLSQELSQELIAQSIKVDSLVAEDKVVRPLRKQVNDFLLGLLLPCDEADEPVKYVGNLLTVHVGLDEVMDCIEHLPISHLLLAELHHIVSPHHVLPFRSYLLLEFLELRLHLLGFDIQ